MTPETLARVHAAAFTDSRPWSAQEFAGLLDSASVILLGDARSFLLGRVIAGEAEVLTIATDPDFRRQGLAQGCLDAFLHALQKQQATSVFLEVAEDNTNAKSLYFNNNFETVGQRSAYYTRPDGTKVAALVLRRDVINKSTSPNTPNN